MYLRIGVFILCLFFSIPAHAQTAYTTITWGDILHTMIKFNALDVVNDDNLIDEFAAVTDCELYEYYFRDDFKWNQVRKVIRELITKNLTNYPSRYHFDAKMKLDRYDFENKLYRFADKNSVKKVNVIRMFDFAGPICADRPAKYLPLEYRAKLDPAITIPGLAISPKDAQSLLNYMDASGNDAHTVNARFNMTVIYIEPFRKSMGMPGTRSTDMIYYQTHGNRQYITIDVRVDSVEFYQDTEMKQLVYTFKPT